MIVCTCWTIMTFAGFKLVPIIFVVVIYENHVDFVFRIIIRGVWQRIAYIFGVSLSLFQEQCERELFVVRRECWVSFQVGWVVSGFFAVAGEGEGLSSVFLDGADLLLAWATGDEISLARWNWWVLFTYEKTVGFSVYLEEPLEEHDQSRDMEKGWFLCEKTEQGCSRLEEGEAFLR